jgi:acyl-CoA synthetase (AMP-forming)/AMP-acid ligase II
MNLAELIDIPQSIEGGRRALTYLGRSLTYEEMVDATHSAAGKLRDCGFGAASRVAVVDMNTPAQALTLVALARLDGIGVPVNSRASAGELGAMLEAGHVDALVAGDRCIQLAEAAAAQTRAGLPVLVTDQWCSSYRPLSGDRPASSGHRAAAGPDTEAEPGDRTVLQLFTSGTVSTPKPFSYTNEALTSYVAATVDLFSASEDDATLVAVPLHHVAGIMGLLGGWFSGRRVVLLPRFDADTWLDTVEQEQISHAFVVPTMLRRILEAWAVRPRDLSSLRLLSYGAAPMPAAVLERAVALLPANVGLSNAFGQTETTSVITLLGPDDHRLDGVEGEEREARRRRLRSAGRPVPGAEIRIVDDRGLALPVDTVGEVAVRAPWLRGDGRRDAGSALEAGWHATGDLGWLDDGGYLFLAGRKDDLIIRGGENISPAQVEAALEADPDVEEACVVGLPDIEWGERLVAAVVRRNASVSDEGLKRHCRERIGSLKTPEEIVFVEDLPRNVMGKVVRRELRRKLTDSRA